METPLISILICSLEVRKFQLANLIYTLNLQIENPLEVEILTNIDKGQKTVGQKRNELLDLAKGEFICYCDDDDSVSDNYIEHLLAGISKGVDCCSLKGSYSVNGAYNGLFEHSIKYRGWATSKGKIKYLRYPNHLNCIKSSIAKQFKFPEINMGEDKDWSTQIHKSRLLKTEYYIDEILYYYNYIPNK